MTDIIIKGAKDDILVKDCMDFVPLEDGTKFGDKKYCNLSFQCKQLGMLAEYMSMYSPAGELILQDYLCTGKHPIFEERSIDEEAS